MIKYILKKRILLEYLNTWHLLGQDPYIGYETIDGKDIPQAEGLSFSVPKSHRKIHPSLKNIFKEIKNNYSTFDYQHGNLKKMG